MSIIKTKSRGINLADNFAFTGNVTGAGTEIEVDQWELPNHFDDGFTSVVVINTCYQRNNFNYFCKNRNWIINECCRGFFFSKNRSMDNTS